MESDHICSDAHFILSCATTKRLIRTRREKERERVIESVATRKQPFTSEMRVILPEHLEREARKVRGKKNSEFL